MLTNNLCSQRDYVSGTDKIMTIVAVIVFPKEKNNYGLLVTTSKCFCIDKSLHIPSISETKFFCFLRDSPDKDNAGC